MKRKTTDARRGEGGNKRKLGLPSRFFPAGRFSFLRGPPATVRAYHGRGGNRTHTRALPPVFRQLITVLLYCKAWHPDRRPSRTRRERSARIRCFRPRSPPTGAREYDSWLFLPQGRAGGNCARAEGVPFVLFPRLVAVLPYRKANLFRRSPVAAQVRLNRGRLGPCFPFSTP